MDPHQLAQVRSLAYHRVIADRIAHSPEPVELARRTLEAWALSRSVHAAYVQSWRELLDGPREELIATLLADDDEARALRQVTPFSGVLSPQERWAIHREVGERERP